MRLRDLIAAIGVSLGLLGLASAMVPGIAANVDLRIVPIPLVGIGASLLALAGYIARRRAVRSRASVPTVEDPVSWPRPGADVDESLRTATTIGPIGRSERSTLREHLWNVAVGVLQATEGCDEETAREFLRAGTWTADSRAISMFAEDPPPTSIGDVARGLLSGQSQFLVNATHAIAALRRRLEEES